MSQAIGLWHDNGQMVIDTRGAVFPERCIASGATGDLTTTTVNIAYKRTHFAFFVLTALDKPGRALAEFATEAIETPNLEITVQVPITGEILDRLSFREFWGNILVAVGLLAFVGGFTLGLYYSFAHPPAAYQLILIIGGIVGALIAGIGGLVHVLSGALALTFTRNQGHYAWVKGAAPLFVVCLPKWSGVPSPGSTSTAIPAEVIDPAVSHSIVPRPTFPRR